MLFRSVCFGGKKMNNNKEKETDEGSLKRRCKKPDKYEKYLAFVLEGKENDCFGL